MTKPLILAALLVLASPLAACSSSDDTSGDTLTVYAASSLTAAFEEIAQDFEAEHDGVDVKLSFGGSSDLVTQVQNGAPADVLASALIRLAEAPAHDLVVDGDDLR